MKVAVSASGPELGSPVDPRFGRCQYLTIVDTDSMDFEAIANSAASAAGGAGISAAQLVVQKGAEAVLTGRCGPNASQVFQASGVPVIMGVGGTVGEAVERYKKGELSSGPQAAMRGGGGGRRMFPKGARTGPGQGNTEALEAEVQDLRGRLDKLTQILDDLKGTDK